MTFEAVWRGTVVLLLAVVVALLAVVALRLPEPVTPASEPMEVVIVDDYRPAPSQGALRVIVVDWARCDEAQAQGGTTGWWHAQRYCP